ncbi:DNA-primase RepB domain-containing protein [Rubellimicrobium arenae]|uniref:DNA-primase RepB domain-containing protein n=1 Tax=Rubellimicrobium arenae TaxID=2817372 RepID=UPI001FED7968|nr:DNA-primase RepB domain-containing protein [Rubellimicrobium arenae]
MEHLNFTDLNDAELVAQTISTADYVRLMHPEGSVGKLSLMVKTGARQAHSKIYPVDEAPLRAECLLDYDAYVTLHRFHGPRKIAKLASLNGLFLDLDVDRVPPMTATDPAMWWLEVSMRLFDLKLPEPTFVLFTGRGLAAIWLVVPLPPQALPRWHAAQTALIELFRSLGADPSCRDAARVTRLPGSINSKSGKEARLITGTLQRLDFDALADSIYTAAGRPARAELQKRKERQARLAITGMPQGLTPKARFRAVLRDLDRVRTAWGGAVPKGVRNSWLHLYATSLAHFSTPQEVESRILEVAAFATPGLPPAEVRALIKAASRHAALPVSAGPLKDGRYHYSGATIAEILGISAEMTQTLGLEQVMPEEERARRKAAREQERRQTAGAATREAWLETNDQERRQPWVELGISRRTYFRRRAAGTLCADQGATTEVGTGPCPLLGGSASPEAQVEGQSPSTEGSTPPNPSRRHEPASSADKAENAPELAADTCFEVVVETHPRVQPLYQPGVIDFARRRLFYRLGSGRPGRNDVCSGVASGMGESGAGAAQADRGRTGCKPEFFPP